MAGPHSASLRTPPHTPTGIAVPGRQAFIYPKGVHMRFEVIPWNGAALPSEDSLRERMQDEGFDVFRWRDEAGADYQPHSHDHHETLWVLDGELVFGAAGREFHLRPGDRLLLPKGTVHTARAGGDGVTYLIGERL